jgi:SNF2 family DNA or RNA helicase
MTDPASLPTDFDSLRQRLPEGFTLSEHVLDPVVQLGRDGSRCFVRLGGVRTRNGLRKIIPTPTPAHGWVVDGTVIRPLPTDAAAILASMIGFVDPSRVGYASALKLLRAGSIPIDVEPEGEFLRSANTTATAISAPERIPGLSAALFPYQARGIQWMRETLADSHGLILADEMGLGKTLQIIALLVLDPPPLTSPALILCPTSLIANWVREITKFAPELSVLVHQGALRAGTHRQLHSAHVVVCTYDTVVNDISIFRAFPWTALICDEAQALKNPDSGRRRVVATIKRSWTIPMTGTPIENSLLDLWSLADLAVPGILGSRQEFERDFPDSRESARELALITDPIVLQRKVADVAGDLPDRIEIDTPLPMEPDLADHYCKVREETVARYPVAGALVATLQLQLVCAHHWLRTPDDSANDSDDAELDRSTIMPLMTPKLERTVQILRESFLCSRKVLIFALFNRCGDIIIEATKAPPHTFWGTINGSTPQQDRQNIIDAFTEYKGPACLILNPKAAGAGLNMTAATVVIHYTPVWNPALEAQASARAHRRGQTQPVTIHRLYYEATVEEVMIDRCRWKSALGSEAAPLGIRDAEDLNRALQVKPSIP